MKNNSYNFPVLCFGGEDWWYHNRGHVDMQLMRRFAKNNVTVYINSIVMQKPSFKKNIGGGKSFKHKFIRKAKSIFRGLVKSDAGFWVYSPISLPVHHLRWARPINKAIIQFQVWLVKHRLKIRNAIVWVACPAACDVAIKTKKKKLIYQRTDRFEEYPNIDSKIIKEYDMKLKKEADCTIFVNDTLYNEEKDQCQKALYLDHGVDYEMFCSAEESDYIPEDIRELKKPIVGFFGGIDIHTTDIKLIEKVVDLLPEISFVFIGNVSSDVCALDNKANVWMLGKKPYEQIPHYGKYFDVAIMPWQQNRWIAACNPIKLKEYLALGKPIVTTPFSELDKYTDVVYKATTPRDFADCILKAIEEDCSDKIAKRRNTVQPYTWDSKAAIVVNELFRN